MSTTIAVVSLAVIVVIFMIIKKIFQNNTVSGSIPNAGYENDVSTYKPPVEIPALKLNIDHSVSYSARSSRSNHSARSPPKKEKKINISKQYVSEGFVSDKSSYNSDNLCKRP